MECCKSKRPTDWWAVLVKNLGDDLLSHGLSHTTIGAAAFHFRVRDGIGWYHSAMVAKETVECRELVRAAPSRMGTWDVTKFGIKSRRVSRLKRLEVI